jgi:catechol 2,3-dioxygenase-like lactoylglutathione lyase family enzyme
MSTAPNATPNTTQNTTKISHVMLGVESTTRSLAFYRDVLGLSVQSEHEGFAFLDAGGFTLALSEGLARACDPRVGATDLVFGVEDVRAAYESLKSKGVEFMHEPRAVAGPMFAANFTDPDGHRLSIFGPERKA